VVSWQRNQREHFVEHAREKQFMESLIEDLENDTVELQRAIIKSDSVATYADSAVMFLRDFKPQARVVDSTFLPGRIGRATTIINIY
jgi:hypothetical protein